MSKPARHLVSVWNPTYAADAMESTVAMLLDLVRLHRKDEIDEEDVYVWWGKVKSSNRQQPMPHLQEILAMDAELSSGDSVDQEMHLYLTDYRSLYVGHVARITGDDLVGEGGEEQHLPAFYGLMRLNCDCWFQLFDIRRVITDDTIGVVEELKKLRNTRYKDRPVSIYGGMVELPLIVTRDDGARYFEAGVREKLTDGRFWVEFDAERSGVGEMERDLRENVVGDATWDALDPAVRTFVATAEALFRLHRKDAAFDFSPVVVDFAKSVELQGNLILRRALSSVRPADRSANVDGESVDVAGRDFWSIGTLARLIGQTENINRLLKQRLTRNGEWFTSSFPAVLNELAGLRNEAAHHRAVSRENARKVRDKLLGIGTSAVLTELARIKTP